MAEHPTTSEKHPPIPGTTAMAVFGLFLFIFFVALTFFLQMKFGTPAP
ncbi:hypothetical protein ACNOYE_11105 [Nannocystaceae bacterium ST9]